MLIWLGVIATESTTLFSGGRTMVWLHRILSFFFPHITWNQVFYVNIALRKMGHFIGYATLSWFAFRGWMETLAYQREKWLIKVGRPLMPCPRWHLRAAVLAVLVTIAVAGVDEYHQARLPGRTGVLKDVVLDTMGGVFAQTLLLLYWTRKRSATWSARQTREQSGQSYRQIAADEEA